MIMQIWRKIKKVSKRNSKSSQSQQQQKQRQIYNIIGQFQFIKQMYVNFILIQMINNQSQPVLQHLEYVLNQIINKNQQSKNKKIKTTKTNQQNQNPNHNLYIQKDFSIISKYKLFLKSLIGFETLEEVDMYCLMVQCQNQQNQMYLKRNDWENYYDGVELDSNSNMNNFKNNIIKQSIVSMLKLLSNCDIQGAYRLQLDIYQKIQQKLIQIQQNSKNISTQYLKYIKQYFIYSKTISIRKLIYLSQSLVLPSGIISKYRQQLLQILTKSQYLSGLQQTTLFRNYQQKMQLAFEVMNRIKEFQQCFVREKIMVNRLNNKKGNGKKGKGNSLEERNYYQGNKGLELWEYKALRNKLLLILAEVRQSINYYQHNYQEEYQQSNHFVAQSSLKCKQQQNIKLVLDYLDKCYFSQQLNQNITDPNNNSQIQSLILLQIIKSYKNQQTFYKNQQKSNLNHSHHPQTLYQSSIKEYSQRLQYFIQTIDWICYQKFQLKAQVFDKIKQNAQLKIRNKLDLKLNINKEKERENISKNKQSKDLVVQVQLNSVESEEEDEEEELEIDVQQVKVVKHNKNKQKQINNNQNENQINSPMFKIGQQKQKQKQKNKNLKIKNQVQIKVQKELNKLKEKAQNKQINIQNSNKIQKERNQNSNNNKQKVQAPIPLSLILNKNKKSQDTLKTQHTQNVIQLKNNQQYQFIQQNESKKQKSKIKLKKIQQQHRKVQQLPKITINQTNQLKTNLIQKLQIQDKNQKKSKSTQKYKQKSAQKQKNKQKIYVNDKNSIYVNYTQLGSRVKLTKSKQDQFNNSNNQIKISTQFREFIKNEQQKHHINKNLKINQRQIQKYNNKKSKYSNLQESPKSIIHKIKKQQNLFTLSVNSQEEEGSVGIPNDQSIVVMKKSYYNQVAPKEQTTNNRNKNKIQNENIILLKPQSLLPQNTIQQQSQDLQQTPNKSILSAFSNNNKNKSRISQHKSNSKSPKHSTINSRLNQHIKKHQALKYSPINGKKLEMNKYQDQNRSENLVQHSYSNQQYQQHSQFQRYKKKEHQINLNQKPNKNKLFQEQNQQNKQTKALQRQEKNPSQKKQKVYLNDRHSQISENELIEFQKQHKSKSKGKNNKVQKAAGIKSQISKNNSNLSLNSNKTIKFQQFMAGLEKSGINKNKNIQSGSQIDNEQTYEKGYKDQQYKKNHSKSKSKLQSNILNNNKKNEHRRIATQSQDNYNISSAYKKNNLLSNITPKNKQIQNIYSQSQKSQQQPNILSYFMSEAFLKPQPQTSKAKKSNSLMIQDNNYFKSSNINEYINKNDFKKKNQIQNNIFQNQNNQNQEQQRYGRKQGQFNNNLIKIKATGSDFINSPNNSEIQFEKSPKKNNNFDLKTLKMESNLNNKNQNKEKNQNQNQNQHYNENQKHKSNKNKNNVPDIQNKIKQNKNSSMIPFLLLNNVLQYLTSLLFHHNQLLKQKIKLCHYGQYIDKKHYTSDGGQQRFLRISQDNQYLQWGVSEEKLIGGNKKKYQIKNIRGVVYGKVTDTMKKQYNKNLDPWKCISFIFHKRTFDIYCSQEKDIEYWLPGISYFVNQTKGQLTHANYTNKIDKIINKKKDTNNKDKNIKNTNQKNEINEKLKQLHQTRVYYSLGRVLWKRLLLKLQSQYLLNAKKKLKTNYHNSNAGAIIEFGYKTGLLKKQQSNIVKKNNQQALNKNKTGIGISKKGSIIYGNSTASMFKKN